MNTYVEIQVNTPAGEAAFVAQWFVNGAPSGQAFPLRTAGELRFFAFFAEAPLIIADDATRAMLCERGYNAVSTVGS